MKVALLGASGGFGQVVRRLIERDFPEAEVICLSRRPGSSDIDELEKVSDCQIVIPSVPIKAFEPTIEQLAPYLQPGSLVVDVCSVKMHPVEIMKKLLPDNVQILATHPMFGPETMKHTRWQVRGLNFVLHPVRIQDKWYSSFKNYLLKKGYNVIEMAPDDHDRHMANSQFYTLLLGTILGDLGIESTPINTKSFDMLLEVLKIARDHDQIVRDSLKFNQYCYKNYQKFLKAMEAYKPPKKSV